MSITHAAVLAPFVLAAFVPLLHRYIRLHTGWMILPLPVMLFLYFLQFLGLQEPVKSTVPWIPSLGIEFTTVMDGLSLLFSLLITGIGSLVILYSIYYMSKREALHQFYLYMLLFMGAMLGVVLSDNVLVLYTFWELTSISSFLLIGYWHHRERSRYGAQKSMLITIFGGLAMLGGFLLLSLMSQTFSIRAMISQASVLSQHDFFIPAMLLVLLGAFTKSAQFPFYIWLPDAMEAPTPVSAYLHSATMVKAGIYLVARMSPIFAGSGEWFWLVSSFGMITLLWGSFQAIKQTDLKAILAFSTVSQLGLIMTLLGIGSASVQFAGTNDNMYVIATTAALFHLLNHATFKGSLFMMVGIVDHETGTRDIRKLGGLMSLMPATFTIAVIGAFSMAGLPPFNGFISKEMFFTGLLRAAELNLFQAETWGVLFPILGWLASVCTFIYSLLLVFKTFAGRLQLPKKPHEAPIGMLISPFILITLVVLFGLLPSLVSKSILEPALAAVLPAVSANPQSFHVHLYLWHGFTPELFMTAGVVLLGLVLFKTVEKWRGIYGWLPKRLTLNHFYDRSLPVLEKAAAKTIEMVMNTSLRMYLISIFGFFIALLGIAFVSLSAFSIDRATMGEVELYELLLAFVMMAAAITVAVASSRLTSILALGAVGYLLSLFFVLFRAPDLALTQLIVETISVGLFLLCFRKLPKLKKERFNLVNAVIAGGVGMIVTLLALSADAQRLLAPISHYFVEASYKEAGGKNMVNVILVDFRGIDTLFEITVLGIAALGIFAMIKLRAGRGER